jgi:repressor LexA
MALTPRQMEVHDFLTRFHHKHGYAPTIAEIREHFHLSSPATVHEQLEALERGGLIRRQKHIQRGIEILQPSTPAGAYEIQLLGVVSAGSAIEAVLTQETISVSPELYGENRFALRVRGDSMRDEQISDGDLLIVERAVNAHNGQTVIALVDDNDTTVKKFYSERGHVRLQPANENYSPIIIKPPQRVKIQGRVVGLIRRYK